MLCAKCCLLIILRLFDVCSSCVVVRCSLFIVCCLMIVRCLLFVVRCLLPVDGYLLLGVCCGFLLVVCCVFVVGWWLFAF